MDFISLLIAEPVGFWETIIVFFESFILDYAWAIIVLTICIKIVLTPLDFMNKKVARDNMRMQEAVAPQLQKLQKQYANDRMKLNQKTQELYKGSGYNMVGSCVIMLINLILTIVIFFTLFSALHTISSYK
ncbi:MAG: YidC/Oxa1 family membrane protein insertase, partial [Clostridia bacterium]|nr:YidC/Oxa1 family membrane protein insertase [Clostridia bacterium]